ncbi:hypothetical protein [Catenovulum agarivorans]|uniref:hypothetical protein n=1 Tax=Catenovulum agarivorans TaxID=1172192 RepID=UPI0002DE0AEC|nr:hypothetical protein [Catenovulum agarivorans]
MKLNSPHIPLGITFEDGLAILNTVSTAIERFEKDNEDFYQVSSNEFSCGFYVKNGFVSSTWYDDSLGRDSEEGINLKVTLYLQRYGDISDWEEGINNGWIQFFSNKKSGIGLAYGLHKDVIRFNQIGK